VGTLLGWKHFIRAPPFCWIDQKGVAKRSTDRREGLRTAAEEKVKFAGPAKKAMMT
jgi:hypothetical protein